VLEEEALVALVQYIPYILQALVLAFQKYQKRNLLILYDAIGTLAESVGDALQAPEYVGMLMPPLVAKWGLLKDDDRDLLPLFQCLANVALALKEAFAPYCETVYARCVHIITQCMLQQQLAESDPTGETEAPDADFIIVSLDLLSAVAEGIGPAVESLVAQHNIMQLVFQCGQDENPEVRQSAFALLGDYAQVCFVHVQPQYQAFVTQLASYLDPQYTSVCNNAAWAIGEIAVQCQEHGLELESLIAPVLQNLVGIMSNGINDGHSDLSFRMPTLMENSGITLGRLGLACPQSVGTLLQHFIKPWCIAMRNLKDNDEKYQAFKGICQTIATNPQGLMANFVYFCDAIISWQTIPVDLRPQFHQILHGVKANAGANWTNYFDQFPPMLKAKLIETYNL